jgi:predicted O-methyltransferase YrrM
VSGGKATSSAPLHDEGVTGSRFLYRHEDRRPRGYEPIYRSFEPSLYVPPIGAHGFLGPAHEEIPEQVREIYGKLMPGDQYKLYEAAYFARGSILEIGRLHGKSTAVLAMGLRDGTLARTGHAGAGTSGLAAGADAAGKPDAACKPDATGKPSAAGKPNAAGVHLYSVELQEKHRPIAEGHLRERGLLDLVTLVQGDSAAAIARLPGSFDTVFVDGDHSYEGFMRDLQALEGRIEPGGVAMFHDCFHPANQSGEVGVARALAERARPMGLAYRGRFGGLALYEQLGAGVQGLT